VLRELTEYRGERERERACADNPVEIDIFGRAGNPTTLLNPDYHNIRNSNKWREWRCRGFADYPATALSRVHTAASREFGRLPRPRGGRRTFLKFPKRRARARAGTSFYSRFRRSRPRRFPRGNAELPRELARNSRGGFTKCDEPLSERAE